MFEKLPSTHWSLRELEVDDAYKLTYTKAWSNDPEATLTFERDFTGYKCYDADCQPLSDEENWLSVRRVEGGAIIDMDREDEGYIVFYDAPGQHRGRQLPLRSQCGHRRHGHRVRISRIRHRRNPRRDHLGRIL